MSIISNSIHPNNNISSHLYPKLNSSAHVHFCNTITYIRLITVLLLRAGYVLIQIGSIPVNDVHSIILHNILDITVTLSSYGLVGYMFSFGQDSLGGFVGSSSSFYAGYLNLDEVIHGFSACLIGSAIITTMLSGRVLPMTAAGASFFHGGLLQPIVMHWVWHEHGWMSKKKIYGIRFSVKDHSGSMVIHLTSGIAALWGSVCLGRRLVKLKEVHESSIGTASPGTTFIGYTFVLIGLISFSLPTQKYELDRIPDDFIGVILVNSVMALTSGLFIVIMQCFCFGRASGYWILLKCLQGCVAGLVTVGAGIDVYDHIMAFLIAAFGALLFYGVTIILERTFYEDYCNLVPIHMCCGFVGAIFPPLLGSKENLGTSIQLILRLYHTLWQILCAFSIALWSTAFFLPLFLFLQAMGLLANKNEELNHQRSLNVLKNIGNPNSFWRIFTFSEFGPSVEPGSETRNQESLKKLKVQYETRRELLEAAMAKKQMKKSPDEQSTVSQQPVVPAEEIVKDMGILDSERYPASYEEVLEKRINETRFVYTTLSPPPSPLKSQHIGSHKKAAGDYLPPSEKSRKQVVEAEVHKLTRAHENTEGSPRKKISPKMRSRNTRRRKRVKRLDSSFNFNKTKRRDDK